MFGKVMDARAAITSEFLEYEICTTFVMGRNRIACPRFGSILTWESSDAIQTCNLCSCRSFALRLDTYCVCSKPTRAGASSEGNVGPGATSGKKTKHEKGMTTGSSTRGDAKKGDAANPSDRDDPRSGASTMAAPKSGSKY
jgi:hypothetical protein